ncbi:MFS general substrate transporter [Auricularia subglabra TFB-10046 SS5]|nr:MFS general substrate transporter [Auricularia subglabra TFB-10046 SS5]
MASLQDAASLSDRTVTPSPPPAPAPKILEAGLHGLPVSATTTLDIEHAQVADDPRAWSTARKYMTLAIIATACLVATMGVNIYNPAINDIKKELGATDQEISLSIALFVIVQGTTPLLWSAVSEIKGRKYVYIISMLMFTVGCAVAAASTHIGVLIGMRVVQALGSSVASAIGAATLADIYDRQERGTKLGIYYSVPLIGPSLGPLVGGIITDVFNWRATFWFLVILGGLMWLCFVFLFKDTFRRERSLTYQRALKHARIAAAKKKLEHHGPRPPSRRSTTQQKGLDDVKLTLADVNPWHPLRMIVRRINNLTILIPSGLINAFIYSVSYTCVRTFSAAPYYYDPLHIGLVLLAFGVGNVLGSIAGGRYSDYLREKCKADPARQATAETRLDGAMIVMWMLPPSVVLYAWFAQEHIHVAAVCVALFFAGFSSIWIYTATLAYIVDANVGRSSAAAATNSCFRGVAGFVSAEIAVPIQDAIGDAGLYMIWAGLMVVMELMVLLTAKRGKVWREKVEEHEAAKA